MVRLQIIITGSKALDFVRGQGAIRFKKLSVHSSTWGILNRNDEPLHSYKNRCEIPLNSAGEHSHRARDEVFESVIDFTCISELRLNPSRWDGHDNRKNGSDFIIRNTFFLGHAKVMLHSRIAANGHCCRHVQHQGGFWVQNIIMTSRIIKFPVFVILFFR